jgi:hypothetical protein
MHAKTGDGVENSPIHNTECNMVFVKSFEETFDACDSDKSFEETFDACDSDESFQFGGGIGNDFVLDEGPQFTAQTFAPSPLSDRSVSPASFFGAPQTFQQPPMANLSVSPEPVSNALQAFQQPPMTNLSVSPEPVSNSPQIFQQFSVVNRPVLDVNAAKDLQSFPWLPVANLPMVNASAANDLRKVNTRLCANPECVGILKAQTARKKNSLLYCSEYCKHRGSNLRRMINRGRLNLDKYALHRQAIGMQNDPSISYTEFVKRHEKLVKQMQKCLRHQVKRCPKHKLE